MKPGSIDDDECIPETKIIAAFAVNDHNKL